MIFTEACLRWQGCHWCQVLYINKKKWLVARHSTKECELPLFGCFLNKFSCNEYHAAQGHAALLCSLACNLAWCCWVLAMLYALLDCLSAQRFVILSSKGTLVLPFLQVLFPAVMQYCDHRVNKSLTIDLLQVWKSTFATQRIHRRIRWNKKTYIYIRIWSKVQCWRMGALFLTFRLGDRPSSEV